MGNNKLITILTPTYNRAHLLPKLYESLLQQISFNFVWMIVDDGSKDNTKEVVDTFTTDKFEVKYIYKENGGKHTALNIGVKECTSILTFIVDSDDWLTIDSIETIEKYYEEYKENKILAGFSFLRKYPDEKINVSTGSNDPYIDTYFNARVNSNRVGDMAEVYYTRVLQEFPFPVYKNEKFIGEDIVWLEISKKYSLLFVEQAIYISNYLEEGLTKNRRKLTINNPIGCYEIAILMLKYKNLRFKLKIKSILQLIIYGKFAGFKFKKIINNKYKLVIILFYLMGLMILYKWKLERKDG